MPRPPVKRNRQRPQNVTVSGQIAKGSKKTALKADNSDDSDGLVTVAPTFPNSVAIAGEDAFMSGGLQISDAEKAHGSIPNGSRTPISKSQQGAIEVPSTAKFIGTGGRPATRPRGYSSTLSFAGRKGDTNSRIPNTPGFESSLLSSFKLRPRQPSILHMMHTDESDIEDDLLSDLSPQDESTPLNRPKGKSLSLKQTSPMSSPLSSKSSRKRKRALEEAQPPELRAGAPSEQIEFPSQSTDEVHDSDSSETACPPTPANFEGFSLTMAPPMSSSPSSSKRGMLVSRHAVRAEAACKNASEESPNRPDERNTETHTKLSTAALQEKCLPRRRLQRRQFNCYGDSDGSEDDVDEVGSDEDELSLAASRKSRRLRNKGLAKTRPKHVKLSSKLLNRKAVTGKKGKKGGHSAMKKPAGITYSSRPVRDPGDKENQSPDDASELSSPPGSDVDPSSTPVGRVISLELERQSKKFAEVDKWQMEFEDVSYSGSQGSLFR
jgi:hypothetical protein